MLMMMMMTMLLMMRMVMSRMHMTIMIMMTLFACNQSPKSVKLIRQPSARPGNDLGTLPQEGISQLLIALAKEQPWPAESSGQRRPSQALPPPPHESDGESLLGGTGTSNSADQTALQVEAIPRMPQGTGYELPPCPLPWDILRIACTRAGMARPPARSPGVASRVSSSAG